MQVGVVLHDGARDDGPAADAAADAAAGAWRVAGVGVVRDERRGEACFPWWNDQGH